MRRSIVLAGVLACIVLCSRTDGQTTRPSGAADSKKPRRIDPDSVLIVNDAHHFQLGVPKIWQETQKSSDLMVFQLPHSPRGLTIPGVFMVSAAKACHPNATLDEQVQANEKLWAQQYKGYQFIKEENMDLDGLPARAIFFEQMQDVMVRSNAGPAQNRPQKQRCMSVICLNHDDAFFSDFSIDAGSFDQRVASVKRALATLTWTGGEKTTAKK